MRSLAKAGIEAWTPLALQRKRRPRSDKFLDVTVAVLPTFVFAPERDLAELLGIVHAPVSDHPPFSVFQYGASFPTVRDSALKPLREFEAALQADWDARLEALARVAKRKRNKTAARSYIMGQRVRIDKLAYSGLSGEIKAIRSNGDLVLAIGGFVHDAIIPACDVVSIQLDGDLSKQDAAA